MDAPGERKCYRNMLAVVREKLATLPGDSHIKMGFTNDILGEISNRIESNKIADLKYGYWPPLFLFLYRRSIPEILAFEHDIDLIVRQSNRKQAREITQFLEAQPQDQPGRWTGGTFETFVKSRLLKERGLAVELDYLLPNGKNTDIRLDINNKPFYVECTVITESDEDREVWDRFLADKKTDPKTILVRPGKFDLSSPKTRPPLLYYDCLRFYAKVYDKLSKYLNPRNSQMGEDAPNVLMISFYTTRSHLSPTSPGVGWALDELLADQPRGGARLKDSPPGIVDISLLAWLDFYANELHSKSCLDMDSYYKDFEEIIAAPRKIGAIFLFEGCSLKDSRVNYNAKDTCRLSHHEIAELEKLLEAPPVWCRQ